MTEERFIEQLNLYIDRELSGDEVLEIEAAIAESPERQRIYAQYCRIERACQQALATSGQAPKPSMAALLAGAAAADGENVVSFDQAANPSRARGSGWGWGAATGLVAACAAFAVYFGSLNSNPQTMTATGDQKTPVATTKVVGGDDDASLAAANAQSDAYRTVLIIDQSAENQGQALRLANTNANTDPFAWMARMQFEPIQPVKLDELEFRTAEPLPVRNLSAFAYPYPGLDDTPPISETAAFQFQR